MPALLVSSLITAAFVVANLWFADAVTVAVLVSILTALIWYILAIVCLFVLRRREPGLFHRYQAPLTRVLPACVALLSLFAVCVYGGNTTNALPLTVILYVVGIVYYLFWARSRIQSAAPEELSAREAGR